jgi:hypothetical protein
LLIFEKPKALHTHVMPKISRALNMFTNRSTVHLNIYGTGKKNY